MPSETQAIMAVYLEVEDSRKYVNDREQAKKLESASSKGKGGRNK